MRGNVVVVMSLAAIAANGCIGGMCTLVEPFPGLNLRVEAAPGTSGLPTGTYEVTIRADGQTLVAHPEIDANGGTCADCELEVDSGGRRLYVEVNLTGRYGDIHVGYREDGGPAQIDLEIRQASTVYVARTFTPEYQAEEVNGRGCGVTHQAHETITVAP